ncbi:VOC family protein [Haliea sp.]
MSLIKNLAYLGFEVSSQLDWEDYLLNRLGLMPAGSAGGIKKYRMDERAARLFLQEGPQNDLCFMGWEVADNKALDQLKARLTESGTESREADDELLEQRGVNRAILFANPDGVLQEVFCGQVVKFEEPFHSPRAISKFVTGDQGLGHIVLNSQNPQATIEFYQNVLGFRLSDFIRFSPFEGFNVDLAFLRCNPRHHSIAVAKMPMPKKVQHFMLQYDELDDVGLSYDEAVRDKLPITLTLGRHTNDHMVSFYMATPSGFEVEVGWGAIEVDDSDWAVQVHHQMSIWGHAPGPGTPPPKVDHK